MSARAPTIGATGAEEATMANVHGGSSTLLDAESPDAGSDKNDADSLTSSHSEASKVREAQGDSFSSLSSDNPRSGRDGSELGSNMEHMKESEGERRDKKRKSKAVSESSSCDSSCDDDESDKKDVPAKSLCAGDAASGDAAEIQNLDESHFNAFTRRKRLDDDEESVTPEGQLRRNPGLGEEEARIAAKREYNRRNAARARTRNKALIGDLQRKVTKLTRYTEDLQRRNDILRAQLDMLSTQNQELMAENASPPAAPATPVPIQNQALLGAMGQLQLLLALLQNQFMMQAQGTQVAAPVAPTVVSPHNNGPAALAQLPRVDLFQATVSPEQGPHQQQPSVDSACNNGTPSSHH